MAIKYHCVMCTSSVKQMQGQQFEVKLMELYGTVVQRK